MFLAMEWNIDGTLIRFSMIVYSWLGHELSQWNNRNEIGKYGFKKEGRKTTDITTRDIPIELGELRVRTFRKSLPLTKTLLLNNDIKRIWFCQILFQVQHAAYMQNVRAVRVLNFLTDENLELICELTAQFWIMIEKVPVLASYSFRLMKIYSILKWLLGDLHFNWLWEFRVYCLGKTLILIKYDWLLLHC